MIVSRRLTSIIIVFGLDLAFCLLCSLLFQLRLGLGLPLLCLFPPSRLLNAPKQLPRTLAQLLQNCMFLLFDLAFAHMCDLVRVLFVDLAKEGISTGWNGFRIDDRCFRCDRQACLRLL